MGGAICARNLFLVLSCLCLFLFGHETPFPVQHGSGADILQRSNTSHTMFNETKRTRKF
ncbi:hypothetical protein CRG98_009788 [Punica granatum]|uniref:Uncharacterized protein n=1 Tax=Punica granatum TaxID=22663 RepID=A0A2I0KNP7_PUNGR|nr:hypothetical protein CRG98_009788 [Punica granatum]